MDIEGEEFAIINAMYDDFVNTGRKLVDYMMIEFHPQVLDRPDELKNYKEKVRAMDIILVDWI